MFSKNGLLEKVRRSQVTIEPVLWTYVTNKDGRHTVRLKVSYNRQTKYFPIQHGSENVSLSKSEWEALKQGRVKGELRNVRDSIEETRYKAANARDLITSRGLPFTFLRFEEQLFAKEVSTDFIAVFEQYLQRLHDEERYGTVDAMKSCLVALKAFLGDKASTLSPYDSTPEFLLRFEKYSRTVRNVGITTAGMWGRDLKTIYNVCAGRDYGLKEVYPFGRSSAGKYQVKNSARGGPKHGDSLTAAELRAFIDSNPNPLSPQYEAKMYWLFSFYCQGMNFNDIARLKYENIQGRVIRYTRQKTKRTEEQEILEVPMSDEIQEILIKMGNEDKRKESYVFRIVKPQLTDTFKIHKDIKQKIQVTNKWLKRLCGEIGIRPITTYWALHTYASLLKYSGVSVEMIRELLGHSEIKTTEHYLKRFDGEAKRAVNSRLIAYINSNPDQAKELQDSRG